MSHGACGHSTLLKVGGAQRRKTGKMIWFNILFVFSSHVHFLTSGLKVPALRWQEHWEGHLAMTGPKCYDTCMSLEVRMPMATAAWQRPQRLGAPWAEKTLRRAHLPRGNSSSLFLEALGLSLLRKMFVALGSRDSQASWGESRETPKFHWGWNEIKARLKHIWHAQKEAWSILSGKQGSMLGCRGILTAPWKTRWADMGSGHSLRMLRAPFQGRTWDLESDRPGLHSWLCQSLAPQPCTSPSNFDSLSANGQRGRKLSTSLPLADWRGRVFPGSYWWGPPILPAVRNFSRN